MFDKNKMYMQIPREIKTDGLIVVLTDINGNEFDAGARREGSELTIDYLQVTGKGIRVIDYVVCADDKGRRFWREEGRRQLITDPKYIFCGRWDSEWS